MAASRRAAILGGSMMCEVVNPSDEYTISAHSFTIAAIAIALLSDGNYGLRYNKSNFSQSTPIISGWDKWIKDRGIDNLERYIVDHAEDIVLVLESMLIGSIDERHAIVAEIEHISDDELESWLTKRHEHMRSSQNDIGARALQLAETLRRTIVEPQTEDARNGAV